MRTFRRICVYCGSSDDVDARYLEAARDLGRLLASRELAVVFGGGRVGMMGAVANGALEEGGEVWGVIPEKLQARELAHTSVTELVVVDSMHARKTIMAALSDAFIALPGGWGTLEEIFEVTTWTQLNYHKKPVGLLNVDHYFDHLLAFLDHAESEGFIRAPHRPIMVDSTDASELLEKLAAVEIPDFAKWIDKP